MGSERTQLERDFVLLTKVMLTHPTAAVWYVKNKTMQDVVKRNVALFEDEGICDDNMRRDVRQTINEILENENGATKS